MLLYRYDNEKGYLMKIIGVDFGEARTGVAVSDEMGLMAHGLRTVFSKDYIKTAGEIAEIVRELGAELIVLGMPKNMNNTVGPRGERTLEFAEKLKSVTDIPIKMWDERLTTVSATRMLNETNTRGKKRKQVLDTVAAEVLLQGYLEMLNKK